MFNSRFLLLAIPALVLVSACGQSSDDAFMKEWEQSDSPLANNADFAECFYENLVDNVGEQGVAYHIQVMERKRKGEPQLKSETFPEGYNMMLVMQAGIACMNS